MEGLRTRVYRGVKRYWGRRHYERLGGKNRDGGNRRRRFWRIRIAPKLKLKLKLRCSPRRLIVRIRDGYVNMMMKLANSPVVTGGSGGGYGEGVAKFGMRPLKEYDEKMIIEIYRSLAMKQAQLMPIDAPHAQQIAVSR